MDDPSRAAARPASYASDALPDGPLRPVLPTVLNTAAGTLALVAILALGRRLTGELPAVDSAAYALGNLAVLGAASLIALASSSRAVKTIAVGSACGLALASTLPGVAPSAWLPVWSLASLLLASVLAPAHVRLAAATLHACWSEFAAIPEVRAALDWLFGRSAIEPHRSSPVAPSSPVAKTAAAVAPSPLTAEKSADRAPGESTVSASSLTSAKAHEAEVDLELEEAGDAEDGADEEALAGDDASSDSRELRCELTRRRSADGVECWSGKLYIELTPGRRTGSEHIAFCPPLPAAPHVEFRQIGGPPARVQATEIRTFGLRWEVKLQDAASEPVRVVVAFTAYAASQASGRAA
ncbi:MAG TPA: hypothetical protein VGE52_14675 [Pirellulales bacterium]